MGLVQGAGQEGSLRCQVGWAVVLGGDMPAWVVTAGEGDPEMLAWMHR